MLIIPDSETFSSTLPFLTTAVTKSILLFQADMNPLDVSSCLFLKDFAVRISETYDI